MHARIFATAVALLLLAGCSTLPNPLAGSPAPSATTPAAPSASGPVAGSAAASDPRVATLTGAGVKPLLGSAARTYMDREEADLRAQLASSIITVTRAGDQIVIVVPAAIGFEDDKAQLQDEAKVPLTAVGALLKKYDQTVVDVYGYTDNQASDAHNKDLSQRRAVAVAAVLAAQGVDQRRFYVLGRGEADPVASNATDTGRSQNSRVEIQISPISWNEAVGPRP